MNPCPPVMRIFPVCYPWGEPDPDPTHGRFFHSADDAGMNLLLAGIPGDSGQGKVQGFAMDER